MLNYLDVLVLDKQELNLFQFEELDIYKPEIYKLDRLRPEPDIFMFLNKLMLELQKKITFFILLMLTIIIITTTITAITQVLIFPSYFSVFEFPIHPEKVNLYMYNNFYIK